MNDFSLEQVMQPMDNDWTMIRSSEVSPAQTKSGNASGETYLFVWTAEEKMPDLLIQACRQLQTDPPQWPGSTVRFEESPEPGFLIDMAKDWLPASPSEEENLFKKLIWEIERAKGKP